MHRLHAAANHDVRRLPVDITLRTPRLPPLFLKGNTTHFVRCNTKDAEKVSSWKFISAGIRAEDRFTAMMWRLFVNNDIGRRILVVDADGNLRDLRM